VRISTRSLRAGANHFTLVVRRGTTVLDHGASAAERLVR
jgi:hypothetical protein